MAKWNILSSCFISDVHFPLYLGRLMSAFMAAFNSSCPYVVTTFIDENCVAYDSLAREPVGVVMTFLYHIWAVPFCRLTSSNFKTK